MTDNLPAYGAVNLEVIRTHYREARHIPDLMIPGPAGKKPVQTLILDVPLLIAETERLDSLLFLNRLEYANLQAAAKATLTADKEGESDPLYYLRDELTREEIQ